MTRGGSKGVEREVEAGEKLRLICRVEAIMPSKLATIRKKDADARLPIGSVGNGSLNYIEKGEASPSGTAKPSGEIVNSEMPGLVKSETGPCWIPALPSYKVIRCILIIANTPHPCQIQLRYLRCMFPRLKDPSWILSRKHFVDIMRS